MNRYQKLCMRRAKFLHKKNLRNKYSTEQSIFNFYIQGKDLYAWYKTCKFCYSNMTIENLRNFIELTEKLEKRR